MGEIPKADTLGECLSTLSGSDEKTVTNLILPHGNNLCAIKPDAENASGVATRKITDERSSLPVPYLYDRVVTTADDPFFVHTHTPHKASVSVGVTLQAKNPGLTRYSTLSIGSQNDSVATGFTYA